MSDRGPDRSSRPTSGSDGRQGNGAPRPIRPASARPPSNGEANGPPPSSARSEAERLQILQIRFKGKRNGHYAFEHVEPLEAREYVIVEADRGQDLGWVGRAVDAEALSCEGGCDGVNGRSVPPPPKRVLRRAAPADVTRLLQLRDQEMEVRRRTRGLVKKHGLKMKVSEAEWQWDRNKLTVYFTAEKRVDFRALVREMARTFRTRIELRQIGVRDEARRLGGLGRCRRELCCRSWLTDIEPVTLQLAKDQGLSLNPSQISGACGRLMSCLRYEHAFYQQAKKRYPPVGRVLRTAEGESEVIGFDLFGETVSLRDQDGLERTVELEQLKSESAEARRGGALRDDGQPDGDPTADGGRDA